MKIGASNGTLISNYGEVKSIEILAKAGFDGIDYNFDFPIGSKERKFLNEASDEEFDNYYRSIKKILEQNKISVCQTHAPFGRIDYMTSQEFFDVVVRCIRATHILGCKYIVVHPIIMPEYKYDEKKEENKIINMEFFTRLIPYLEKYDVKNGVENMWNYDDVKGEICPTVCSRPEEIIDYIETIKSDRFVACLDLGHINLTGGYTGDTVDGAIRKLGKYIEIVHIHDTDGKNDLHVPPFMGNIDWIKVAKAFKEIDYKGVINFEVGGAYFNKFDKSAIQESANYMAQTAKFLSFLIKNS